MITAVVGRTFLNAYNQKFKKELSPKEFFDQEFYPLFYDNEKYLMSVTNSPFDQGYKQKRHLTESGRAYDLNEFRNKVSSGKTDASIYLGAPASDEKEFATTSGQVTDIEFQPSEDEVLLSWIGSGLGIMVAGAYMLLFDDPLITLQTFEGWEVYRKYLNDDSLKSLKPNQVNTWNGQWLAYSLGTNFQEDFDFSTLQNNKVFRIEEGSIGVDTVYWTHLCFSLSQKFATDEMVGYVYSFGQMNKTIGFIPFQFKSGNRLKDIYRQLFNQPFSNTKEFEELFGMHIKRACELGSIGILALRPDSITKYMIDVKNLSFKKEEDIINYQAYKTWLVAMLSKNKEEIKDYTLELAKTILKYRNDGSKNDRKNLIERELFASPSKKGFIEALGKMVKDLDNDELLKIKQLKDDVHLMTNEEYGYFSTLLKFDYAFVEKQS